MTKDSVEPGPWHRRAALPLTKTARDRHAFIQGLVLVVAQCLPVVAVVGLFPAIPRLFQQFGHLPHGALLVPMIITITSLCLALTAPLMGWLADRMGRARLLNICLGAYIAAGLAPLLLDGIAPIIASRGLLGVAEAGVVITSGALTADYFGEQRQRWLAIQNIVSSLCGTLLLAAGGALADVHWRAPFIVYAFALPFFVLSVLCPREPTRQPAQLNPSGGSPMPARKRFSWRTGAQIVGITTITSLLYYVEPLHIARVLNQTGVPSQTLTGLLLAFTSLGYITGSLLYKRVAHSGLALQLALAGLLMGAGLIGIGSVRGFASATAWALVQQLGAGLVLPSLIGWVQSCVPVEQRGQAMGIWATAFFGGFFLCPPLVEAVASWRGGLQAGLLDSGIATVLLPLAWYAARASAVHRESTFKRHDTPS